MPLFQHVASRCSALALTLLVGATLVLAGCDSGALTPTQLRQADALATAAQSASAVSCANRVNNTVDKLLQCVTLDGVREHQAAFQAIADANGGNRADGTPGYAASVDYVVETLEGAGWDVNRVPFSYEVLTAELSQSAPVSATYATGGFTGTGLGDVTGGVIPVDINLTPPRTNTSGCEPADFTGLDFSGPSDIALIQRGACFFSVKAANAEAAGAEAVVFFNQGNTPEREGLIVGTAAQLPDGSPSNLTIPVVGASFNDGVALAQTGAIATVRAFIETITSEDVIAELPGKNPDNVVIAGGHLDGVSAGPGIQDNGSGSAALLETALQLAKVKPRNTLRFAWWGAEEAGLIGSTSYVNNLTADELEDIALYLNFDMIASPNFVYFVYDGDDSDGVGAGPGPDGSAEIEALFESYYDGLGLPYKGTDFNGRSDYFAFINAGIPAGGLFTGAGGIKTPDEAALWGGTAGTAYDPCWHLACDTFDNVSLEALEVNADAVAFAALSYAMNTELINGVKGKGNFKGMPGPKMPAD